MRQAKDRTIAMEGRGEVTLSEADFSAMLGEALSGYVEERVREYGLTYAPMSAGERDACLLRIVRVLTEIGLEKAGAHTLEKWEKGWDENLQMLSRKPGPAAVVPLYFGKNEVVRLRQEFVRPLSADFEYRIYCLVLDWLFDAYVRDADHVYEFGCGPGYNLLRLRKLNPGACLWGLDWARSSQKVIEKMALEFGDSRLFGRRFDYFEPDYGFRLEPGSVVCTFASLEQVGAKFGKFVEYLLDNRPALCIHVEPIAELLDGNNLLDYLSICYFRKRNYLEGFLDFLRGLEREGRVEIVKAKRTYTGSFFIEGHSVVVWRPV